ncbi:hypothetical protein C3K47_15800 [Solitalea longa]|uniref:Sensory/regulatory protein RpfC n=1 Tax=Solitalea longa TaxID=2079460 RepID=A0A2S4ZZ24_9SPHI|nr:PAS domain-containing hybrid sensor histidine kinase/response regulator [Solitalea longa]POY35247.1 hypothetical protein C3K47_15800 [Solitalea longa]
MKKKINITIIITLIILLGAILMVNIRAVNKERETSEQVNTIQGKIKTVGSLSEKLTMATFLSREMLLNPDAVQPKQLTDVYQKIDREISVLKNNESLLEKNGEQQLCNSIVATALLRKSYLEEVSKCGYVLRTDSTKKDIFVKAGANRQFLTSQITTFLEQQSGLLQYYQRENNEYRTQANYSALAFFLAVLVCACFIIIKIKDGKKIRQMLAVAKAENENYFQFIENLPANVWITDKNLNVKLVSKQAAATIDHTKEEILAKYAYEFLAPESYPVQNERQRWLSENSGVLVDELIFIRTDKERVHLRMSSSTIGIGGEIYYLHIGENICREKEAERKNLLAQTIFDNSTAYMWAKDLEGRYIMANKRFNDFVGTDVVGKLPSELYSQEAVDSIQVEKELAEAKNHEKIDFVLSSRLYKVNPSQQEQGVHLALLKFPLWDSLGNLVGIGRVGTDMTNDIKLKEELIKAKERAEQSEQQISQLANSLENGMMYQVALYGEGRRQFKFVSDAVEKMYGFTAKELLEDANVLYSKVHPDDAKTFQKIEAEAIEKMLPFNESFRMVHKDGKVSWTSVYSSPRYIDGVLHFDGVATDITKQKLVESELLAAKEKAEQSEAKLHQVADNIAHGMIYNMVFREDGKRQFTFASSAVQEMYDCTLEEAINDATLIERTTHPDDVAALVAAEQQAMATMSAFKHIYRVIGKNGNIRWLSVNSTPYRSNGLFYWDGVIVDITDQKQAEAELLAAKDRAEKSEMQTKQIANNLSNGLVFQKIFDHNNKRHYTFISDGIKRLCGCTPQEAMKDINIFYSRFNTDDLAAFFCKEQESLANMSPLVHTARMFDMEGQMRWVSICTTPSQVNGITYWDGVLTDISEQKQIEQELVIAKDQAEASSEFTKAIFESTTDFIWTMDATDFSLITCNSTFRDFFKEQGIDIQPGITTKDILPSSPEYTRTWLQYYNRALTEGPYQIEYTHEIGPTLLQLLLNFGVVRKDNKAVAITIFGKDITQQKKVETELLIAKEKAEASEKLQEQFLANMSHEIRTPLNGIIGMNRLLLNTSLKNEQQEFADAVKTSSDTLLVIINDILDLSKIKAGKMTFESINFSLIDIILCLESNFRANLKKDIQLELMIENEVPPVLTGDPVRVRQILVNLIGNALKFTSKGKVSIHCGIQSKPDNDSVEIFVAISDTGIGMTEEQQKRVFAPFTQAEQDTTRKYGGTGLGLSITRQLVELQNGTLSLQSEAGKGSVFTFTLPFGIGDEDSIKKQNSVLNISPETFKGKRILLAEDQEINQRLVINLVRNAGGEIIVAGNGQIAIEVLETGEQFDLILMDRQMPEMDGFTATQHIRKELKMTDIPIIAMTAEAMKGERENCIEVGMDDYIAKPFEFSVFYNMLSKYLIKSEVVEVVEVTAQTIHQDHGALFCLSQIESMEDDEYTRDMILIYADTIPPLLQRIKESIVLGKWEEVFQQAHKAKSPVGLFQATTLYELLRDIELSARQKTELDLCTSRIEEAIEINDKIVKQLKSLKI